MKAWKWVLVGMGWVVAAACVESEPAKPPVVEDLRVSASSLTLVRGQVRQVVATPIHSNGRELHEVTVRFRSSDEAVATVDSRGWVEAIERGEATVFATAQGAEVEIPIQVRRPVERVVVEPEEAELVEGQSLELRASAFDLQGEPVDGPLVTHWRSEDPELAVVAADGRVTARRKGTATLRVTMGEGAGEAVLRVLPRAHRIRITGLGHEPIEGEELFLYAVALGSDDFPVGREVSWTSTAPDVATVDGGRVRARSAGEAGIVASLDGVEEVWPLRVLPAVASIEIVQDEAILYQGGRSHWSARLLAADGTVTTGRNVRWSTSDPAVAEIDADGWVVGKAEGFAEIRAHAEDEVGVAEVQVIGEASLSIRGDVREREEPGHSFTLEAEVLATGGGAAEALEIRWRSHDPEVASVDATGRVEVLALGTTTLEVRTGGLRATLPFAASLRFDAIAAGDAFSCGVTEHGALWCWGANDFGQLGDGAEGAGSFVPRRVEAEEGLRFTSVTAGSTHACALTEDGAAFCWGDNRSGALQGDPSLPRSSVPLPAVPEERFSSLRAGLLPFQLPEGNEGAHTCGITLDDRTLCWGNGKQGQLGHGVKVVASGPVEPAGGHRFVEVHPSAGFTCGLTDAGVSYCWGHGPLGRPLEVGFFRHHFSSPTPHRSIPDEPDEPPVFVGLTAGRTDVCGIDVEGQAYCWGAAIAESLGGSGYVYDPERNVFDYLPLGPVSRGPTRWTSLAVGASASCGIDTGDLLHCWGRSTWLHDPDMPCERPRSPTPQRRHTEGTVRAVTLGRALCAEHGCVLLENGRVQCWGDSRSGQAGAPSGRANEMGGLYPDR